MSDFYVYLHRKKTNGEVFYVGKGKGRRAFSKNSRSVFWWSIVNKHEYYIEIVEHGIQEWYAHELEVSLIYLYGRRDLNEGSLVNLTSGGEGTTGIIQSKEHRDKTSMRIKGRNHPLYENTVYTFTNAISGETITSDRYGFEKEYPKLILSGVLKNTQLHVGGWYIKGQRTSIEIDIIRNGLKGINCHASDKTIYNFYNLKSGEVFEGLRVELQSKYDVDISPLFSGCLKHNNWCLLDTFRQYGSEYLLNSSAGIRNGRSDKNCYDFYNLKTKEHISLIRTDFEEKYQINIAPLFNKSREYLLVKDWCLLQNRMQAEALIAKNTYRFIHQTGETFTGTRVAFKKKYGICTKNLFRKCKTIHGWSLLNQ